MGLLGVTPIGIIDGLVVGVSATLPLLINEATKKTVEDFVDLTYDCESVAQMSEIEPETCDGVPMGRHVHLQSQEYETARI